MVRAEVEVEEKEEEEEEEEEVELELESSPPSSSSELRLRGTPLLTTTAAAPAARASCPPFPGRISTLCTGVPTGISERGRAQPGETGEPGPEEIASPGFRPAGARM